MYTWAGAAAAARGTEEGEGYAVKLADILRARLRQEEGGPAEAVTAPEPVGDYVTDEEVQWIPIGAIDPSPFQARRRFDEEGVRELAASIQLHGVLQPIIVRPRGNRFELVVGERRWRACSLLGWKSIPAVVREMGDQEAAEAVLTENLQRHDLNPVEEARGYERMLTTFNMTQQALAERLGVSQPTIANKLRLLRLPEEVQAWVEEGKLSERHARALLKAGSKERQRQLAAWAVEHGATVRDLEARIGDKTSPLHSAPASPRRREADGDVQSLLRRLEKVLEQLRAAGASVDVAEDGEGQGIQIRVRIPDVKR